ncbi:fork head domain-containing protein [Daldinia caldariorum]|uniref:fork head domain-containing protein n=1 Tax=Daldinia caldariorum TaxID=326644 RepID=UPI002008DF3C|nr:fork head domain-containing protein [Daldinia caldariorum]KAI1465016.1 fork head domain-containing protein [Daldinia caldariorum]
MPPSSKRSQRTRRHRDISPSPAPPEQSSPSRPSKRRRKGDEAVPELVEDEGSSLTVDNSAPEGPSDDDRLITQVTQHLRSIQTQASKDHANAIHEAKTEDIEAYAKISAHDWTYYIKTLSINIGRTSEPSHAHAPAPRQDRENDDFVHIDLGPSKTFSRQTAVIYYDSEPGRWFIQAKGRNGIKVNNIPMKKTDTPHPLSSGEVIEIGGIEMMFVLPASLGPLEIHPMYLEQAGIKPSQSTPARETGRTALPTAPPADHPSSQPARPSSSRGQPFQQPIAPAPPDYRRPGTPPSARSRPATSHQQKTPAHGSSGTVIMSQSDVDLTKDENKHIKPHFSYAQMITQAIMSTPEEKLNLAGIYQYIMKHYAYYRHQPPSGWQNSIRHNLSLNKSFMKAPRTTDEPGKGMKWEIVPEARDEMIRVAYKGGRGGHRGSSVPSSPSQPSQLSYITHGPRELTNREPASTRKRKASPIASPPPKSSFNLAQVTPDRKYLPTESASFQDGSPLPRRRALDGSSFDATQTLPQSPPTLSSSFLQDESASFVTPAPHRVHPRLAPPSTAQRPSQHMPTSSPAPFWKYADIGSTPLKPPQFDVSPLKPMRRLANSSSPPPAAGDGSPAASPSRSIRSARTETQDREKTTAPEEEEEEEGGGEGGFDLTKGFQSIGSYHANLHFGGGLGPRANGRRV